MRMFKRLDWVPRDSVQVKKRLALWRPLWGDSRREKLSLAR